MVLVKLSEEFFDLLKKNGLEKEVLFNEDGRPCVLLINMMYKGTVRQFIVPIRSNISSTAPKRQYFALPPNKNTRANCHHGVHYIKITPVTSQYIERYRIKGNKYMYSIQQILDKRESIITKNCQMYLNEYESGNKNPMTPDIDGILELLNK